MLLTFNVYADVKVEITNNINSRAYGAKFKTKLEADTWKAKNIANDSWGKKQRWVEKTDQTNCLQERDILPDFGPMRTECELPDDYTILSCDTDVIYESSHDCKAIVDSMKSKKTKKDKAIEDLAVLRTSMEVENSVLTLKEISDWVKLKEGL